MNKESIRNEILLNTCLTLIPALCNAPIRSIDLNKERKSTVAAKVASMASNSFANWGITLVYKLARREIGET